MNNIIEYNQQYRNRPAQVSHTFLKPLLTALLTILFAVLVPFQCLCILTGAFHWSFFIFLLMASVIYLLIKLNTDREGYF